ncbi:hypothetical protein [Streptomyces chryseus]|uniref:Uncharacterized protein n=1 Tax=Streptomyces chryseus TaxID=68186 RepID=A0ABQ3DHP3_9ACTN|nr:hypothetical protein [Streptomyces chryseus]GGX42751.1 hypothetical protein GCM10010353_67400 [Streptomyces chryseus]GHA96468.1 hypothetical protein GCM10010346_19050 [Streptomyces chryseus]
MQHSRKADLAAALDRKNAVQNRGTQRPIRDLLPAPARRGGNFRAANAPRRGSY